MNCETGTNPQFWIDSVGELASTIAGIAGEYSYPAGSAEEVLADRDTATSQASADRVSGAADTSGLAELAGRRIAEMAEAGRDLGLKAAAADEVFANETSDAAADACQEIAQARHDAATNESAVDDALKTSDADPGEPIEMPEAPDHGDPELQVPSGAYGPGEVDTTYDGFQGQMSESDAVDAPYRLTDDELGDAVESNDLADRLFPQLDIRPEDHAWMKFPDPFGEPIIRGRIEHRVDKWGNAYYAEFDEDGHLVGYFGGWPLPRRGYLHPKAGFVTYDTVILGTKSLPPQVGEHEVGYGRTGMVSGKPYLTKGFPPWFPEVSRRRLIRAADFGCGGACMIRANSEGPFVEKKPGTRAFLDYGKAVEALKEAQKAGPALLVAVQTYKPLRNTPHGRFNETGTKFRYFAANTAEVDPARIPTEESGLARNWASFVIGNGGPTWEWANAGADQDTSMVLSYCPTLSNFARYTVYCVIPNSLTSSPIVPLSEYPAGHRPWRYDEGP